MAGGDFTAVRGRLFQLHAVGDHATALEVARSAARDFPEEADRTTYWIACLLAPTRPISRSAYPPLSGGLWAAPLKTGGRETFRLDRRSYST